MLGYELLYYFILFIYIKQRDFRYRFMGKRLQTSDKYITSFIVQ